MQYKRLFKREHFGSIDIGVDILVSTSTDISSEDWNRITSTVGYDAEYSIHQELQAAILSKDSEAKARAIRERRELLALFGSYKIYVEEIPNGYCPRACCRHLPWFVVTTEKGRIKIGWRKSVINIDWSELSGHYRTKAELLFPDEDVTKGEYSIHAWGLEKAQQYINKLLN